MPSVEVTERQWKFFQKVTGQTRPGSKIREVLDEYMQLCAVLDERRKVQEEQTAPDVKKALDTSPFAARWKAIGCAKRTFDDFNKARDWYISKFDSEETALTELEERHRHESLRNPRGWIYRKWLDSKGL